MNYPHHQHPHFGQPQQPLQNQNPSNGLVPPQQHVGGNMQQGQQQQQFTTGVHPSFPNAGGHANLNHGNPAMYGGHVFSGNHAPVTGHPQTSFMHHNQHGKSNMPNGQSVNPHQFQPRYQQQVQGTMMPNQQPTTAALPNSYANGHYGTPQANFSRQPPATTSHTLYHQPPNNYPQTAFTPSGAFAASGRLIPPNNPTGPPTSNYPPSHAHQQVNHSVAHRNTMPQNYQHPPGNNQGMARNPQFNAYRSYGQPSNVYSNNPANAISYQESNVPFSMSNAPGIQYQGQKMSPPEHNAGPQRKSSMSGASGGIVNLASFYPQQQQQQQLQMDPPSTYLPNSQISDGSIGVHPGAPTGNFGEHYVNQQNSLSIPKYPGNLGMQQPAPMSDIHENKVDIAHQYKYIEDLLSYLTSLLEHPSLVGDIVGDWPAKKAHILKFRDMLQQNMKKTIASLGSPSSVASSFLPQEKMHLLVIQLKKLIVGLETKIPQVNRSQTSSMSNESVVPSFGNATPVASREDTAALTSWNLFSDLDDLLGLSPLLTPPPKPFYIYPFEKLQAKVGPLHNNSVDWILGMNFQSLLLCLEQVSTSEFCVKQVVDSLSEFKSSATNNEVKTEKELESCVRGDLPKMCDYYLSLLSIAVPCL